MKNKRKLPCTIDGIEYKSEAMAARALGVSKTTIQYRLRSTNFPNYISKHKPKVSSPESLRCKKYPCTIDGIEYESEQVAANALGINAATLRGRLSSPKFPEYTSEYYHKIRLHRVPCVVAGVEYESITSAVKKLEISYGEMIKRLHSFDYPDYVSVRHPKIRFTPKNPSISCTINGIEYKSLTSAAKDLGISLSTLRYRLGSSNFPGYVKSE